MLEKIGLLLLWAAALYHLVMGAFSFSSTRLTRAAVGSLYGAQYADGIDAKLEFIWKPLGAFALLFSAFCFRAIFVADPSYRAFALEAFGALLWMRAFIRIWHQDLLYRAHFIPKNRNYANAAFNAVIGILCFASAQFTV